GRHNAFPGPAGGSLPSPGTARVATGALAVAPPGPASPAVFAPVDSLGRHLRNAGFLLSPATVRSWLSAPPGLHQALSLRSASPRPGNGAPLARHSGPSGLPAVLR